MGPVRVFAKPAHHGRLVDPHGDAFRYRSEGYEAMGETGMGNMMEMGTPKNTLPMMTGSGPYGPVEMGGMFTILKVRDGIRGYQDPGWYENPAGTLASIAEADDLRRDGIDVRRPPVGRTHGRRNELIGVDQPQRQMPSSC